MRPYTLILFAVLSLLGISTVFGSSLGPIRISPTSITIPTGVTSFYNITFTDNQTAPVNLTLLLSFARIEYSGIFSNIGATPASFYLQPNQSKTILFSFVTNSGVYFSTPRNFVINYTENGLSEEFVLSAPIVNNPVYIYSLSAPGSFVPSQPLSVSLDILNGVGQVPVTVPVTFSLINSIGASVFSYTHNLELSNSGLNTFVEPVVINNTVSPGNYTLYVSLSYTSTPSALSKRIDVLPYYKIDSAYSSNTGVLGGTVSKTVENVGNEPYPVSNLSLGINGFLRLFVSSLSSSMGNAVLSGGAVSSSVPFLLPGQTISLSYNFVFYPIYIIILAVAVAVLVYLFFNRKVVLSKEIVEHKASGGVIDVKVAVRIKNISKKTVRDLIIHDLIPPNSLKITPIGPKQGRIYKAYDGMRITWRESVLEPSDEIILMYEIKSKIGIVGGIDLKSAYCTFTYEGKEHKRKSNPLVLRLQKTGK